MTWAQVWDRVKASLVWPPKDEEVDADYENWLASLSDPEDEENASL